MKLLDLALLGGAAYLLFSSRGGAASSDISGGGISPSALPPSIPGTTIPASGKVIPATSIPTSVGFQAKMEISAPSAVEAITAAKAPLGGISVAAAPTVVTRSSSGGSSTSSPQISAAAKAEVTQIFQKEYISGNFVPSSVLAGKMTKTDIIIAQNLAKKSFN